MRLLHNAAFDYIRAAGEVLAKTGNGGKAFDAYCHMRKVRPRYTGYYEAYDEMRRALSGVFPLTVENCSRAFEQELFKAHLDEWVEA